MDREAIIQAERARLRAAIFAHSSADGRSEDAGGRSRLHFLARRLLARQKVRTASFQPFQL